MKGLVDMSATTVIKDILEVKGKSQIELADALEMNLILKDKADGIEYVIDYPEDEKGKLKRNMTEEEKKAAQKKSEETKARNAKRNADK